jgi:DNA-binding MarR family transcriptional regulator
VSDIRDNGPPGESVGDLESALHSLVRQLKQTRLHEFLLAQAGADVDRAGLALLYVLYQEETSLRLTELAEQLRIDAPAVSRKAQQLERSGLVGRGQDQRDGRATRLRLTESGRGVIDRILAARREWLAAVLSDWSAAEQSELARLMCQFADSVERNLEELDD